MLTAEAREFEAAINASPPPARHPGALPPGVPASPTPRRAREQRALGRFSWGIEDDSE